MRLLPGPLNPGAQNAHRRCRDHPRCAACEAPWLPADETRWQAWLYGRRATRARVLLPGLRRARVRRRLRITQAARAPMPRYLASADGGARPVASARPGSGRSRLAGRRRRTRLEARGQVKAAIRPHDSVQHSSPPRCGKAVENLGCRSAGARWASSGRSGDFTTLGPECSHSNGGRAKKTSERARTSQPLPKRLSPSRRSYGAAVRDTR